MAIDITGAGDGQYRLIDIRFVTDAVEITEGLMTRLIEPAHTSPSFEHIARSAPGDHAQGMETVMKSTTAMTAAVFCGDGSFLPPGVHQSGNTGRCGHSFH
jgi:hypothetical protein